jgi:hypothetical protein
VGLESTLSSQLGRPILARPVLLVLGLASAKDEGSRGGERNQRPSTRTCHGHCRVRGKRFGVWVAGVPAGAFANVQDRRDGVEVGAGMINDPRHCLEGVISLHLYH